MGNCKIAGVITAGVFLCALAAFAASAEYELVEVGVFGPYDEVADITCSLDGNAWGFCAKKEDGYYALINGEEFGPYSKPSARIPTCSKNTIIPADDEKVFQDKILFSRDGSHWGIDYSESDNKFLIIDGNKFGPYSYIFYFAFSRNDSSWRYVYVTKSNNYYAYAHGKEYGPYSRIEFTPWERSAYYARLAIAFTNGDLNYVNIEGTTWGPYDGRNSVLPDVVWSRDYSKWGFWVKRSDAWYYVINGLEKGPYADWGTISFSYTGSLCGVTMKDEDGEYASIGPEKFGPYDSIDPVVFPVSGDSYYFKFRKKDAYFANVNGTEYGPFNAVDRFLFSNTGDNWGFIGTTRKGAFAVISGIVYGPYVGVDGFLMSPNGNVWILLIDKAGPRYVIINGREFGPFAFLKGAYFWGADATISGDGSSCAVTCLKNRVYGIPFSDVGLSYLFVYTKGKVHGPYLTGSSSFRIQRDFGAWFWASPIKVGEHCWYGVIEGEHVGPYETITTYPHNNHRYYCSQPRFDGAYLLECGKTGMYRVLKYVSG